MSIETVRDINVVMLKDSRPLSQVLLEAIEAIEASKKSGDNSLPRVYPHKEEKRLAWQEGDFLFL